MESRINRFAMSLVKPLHVSFVITSMPVGGAETLLVNLMRHFNREKVNPSLICLKEAGPLGEELAKEFEVVSNLYRHKWDLRILPRLKTAIQSLNAEAVVTVGAGDKMFWGRLAARWARVPVIASALHSTGWPDGVGRLNRWLDPCTDAYIAVAEQHAEFLRAFEHFPAEKVVKIPNGIDTERFSPNSRARAELHRELGISKSAPVVGIVAALRSEKNHLLFVDAARKIANGMPDTQFVIVGDGPCRSEIEQHIAELGMTHRFHLLGTRHDTPRILAGLDVFVLSSHNEAFPVSILEALSCEVPVVATRVGSVTEAVIEGQTGFAVLPSDADGLACKVTTLLEDPALAMQLGKQGRQQVVERFSLANMVAGYEQLLMNIYAKKTKHQSANALYPSCKGMVSRPF